MHKTRVDDRKPGELEIHERLAKLAAELLNEQVAAAYASHWWGEVTLKLSVSDGLVTRVEREERAVYK